MFYTERLRPEVQPPTLIYIPFFSRKGTRFVYLWFLFHIPSLELWISFNGCKCTPLWNMKKKKKTFLDFFTAIKCNSLPLRPLLRAEMIHSLTIHTLQLAWSLNKVPFRAEPPCIGHYRVYPSRGNEYKEGTEFHRIRYIGEAYLHKLKSQLRIHRVIFRFSTPPCTAYIHVHCICQTLPSSSRPCRFVNRITTFNKRKFLFINKLRTLNQGIARAGHN